MHVGIVARGDMAYALDLANLLIEAGLRITLYLSYDHAELEIGASDNILAQLYKLGMLSQNCEVRLIRPPRMRNPFSILTYLRLRKTMQDDGVEIAHILAGPHELWLGVLALIVRKIPVISTMIVPKPNVGGSLPHILNLAINAILAFGSDIIVVNGDGQVEYVKKQYGMAPSRLIFIPLNVPKREIRHESEEAGTVLFFGAARYHKGLEYLIRAQPMISRKVPYARVLISAHGEELPRCLELIEDRNGFEIHEGFLPRAKIAELFQRASLVVLPYLSASTSGVLITAYSYGKPVIATNVGCLPDYVNDGFTGLMVNPANAAQLADAVVRLLIDNDLRASMRFNITNWRDKKNEIIVMKTIYAYRKAIAIHAKS